jgi:hypothetical protein
MFSLLKPTFVYDDVSSDITETDVDVVSDLWNMDGRDVYRGSRDPRYTHANVYWLYNEDLQRVGCAEHSLEDHADVRLLWFQDSEFGTLLQEEGWQTLGEDIWSLMPSKVFDRFVNEGWTTPKAFLEQCLSGPVRLVTVDMLVHPPSMYVCNACGKKSLTPKGCIQKETPLDFPSKEKLFFVDLDMIVHVPPPSSSIWSRLHPNLQPGDDSSEQALAQGLEQQTATPP